MFGVPGELTLAGHVYRLNPKVARKYGQIEAKILSLRPDPIKMMKRAYDEFNGFPEVQESIIRQGMEQARKARFVTAEETRDYLYTPDGTIFLIYICAVDFDASLTEEQVRTDYLDEVDRRAVDYSALGLAMQVAASRAQAEVMEMCHEVIDRISGEDALGNSTGLGSRKTPSQTEESGDQSPGEESAGD